MGNIDILEAAQGGPFVVRSKGDAIALPGPANLSFQVVLAALQASHAPGTPPCKDWQATLVGQRWAAHHDLPDFQSAQRLAYLIDRYRSALVYDLRVHCGVDLGDLWRARKWRTLLDLIDHLPSHSWYSAAVSGDEEHAAMIAESLARRESEGEQTPSGPPLHTWTPEVSVLTALRDDVRQLAYIIPASAGDKKVKPPEPLARPHTPLEAAMKRASLARRKQSHDALVARLLPHKAKQTD